MRGQSYYELAHSNDGVRIYAQHKTVADKPNCPPSGPFACHLDRQGGYADYKKGYFYIPLSSVRLSFNGGVRKTLKVTQIVEKLSKLSCYVGKNFKSWNRSRGSRSGGSDRRNSQFGSNSRLMFDSGFGGF